VNLKSGIGAYSQRSLLLPPSSQSYFDVRQIIAFDNSVGELIIIRFTTALKSAMHTLKLLLKPFNVT